MLSQQDLSLITSPGSQPAAFGGYGSLLNMQRQKQMKGSYIDEYQEVKAYDVEPLDKVEPDFELELRNPSSSELTKITGLASKDTTEFMAADRKQAQRREKVRKCGFQTLTLCLAIAKLYCITVI